MLWRFYEISQSIAHFLRFETLAWDLWGGTMKQFTMSSSILQSHLYRYINKDSTLDVRINKY